jgi:hypothetical protein
MRSSLFGVSAIDLFTVAPTIVAMLAFASRIDPMTALRND